MLRSRGLPFPASARPKSGSDLVARFAIPILTFREALNFLTNGKSNTGITTATKTPPNKMRLSNRYAELDSQFSFLVRSGAGWRCEKCGTRYEPPTRALHTSHFWGRSNLKVRWDYDNVSAHCYGCHSYFEQHPQEFVKWQLKKLGKKRFEDLTRRANWRTKKKTDVKLIALWLTQEMKKHLRLSQKNRSTEPFPIITFLKTASASGDARNVKRKSSTGSSAGS